MLDVALHRRGCVQDVVFRTDSTDGLRFVHRHLADGELYWVTNTFPQAREVTVSFRVTGKRPLLLHAETGGMEEASYVIREGRTLVRLRFVPDDALFVWFGEKSETDSLSVPQDVCRTLQDLTGGRWRILFRNGGGATDSFETDTLFPLNCSDEPDIRFFSGTVSYNMTFQWHDDGVGDSLLCLDLGEVCHLARVFLNGEDIGCCWKAPYRLLLSGRLREGNNTLEIRVTNTWANRLTGDSKEAGWTAQIHFGCMRNNNSRMYREVGADTGFDSIGEYHAAVALNRLFSWLDSEDAPASVVADRKKFVDVTHLRGDQWRRSP